MEIYLDNAATTRPWPEVVRAVTVVMESGFGNPSSLHRRGLSAARAVAEAARQVEALVGGTWKVLFTSGATEADNLAVLGSAPRGRRGGIVTTSLEHAAVEEACRSAEQGGCNVTVVRAGADGLVDPAAIAAAVDERTALVTLNHVAGEIGTVQPVAEIARLVKLRAPRAWVHVDGVQAMAQLARVDYPPEVDMVTISSHKIHGPQGVGALLVRPSVKPRALLFGGDQQDGLRPGTLNVPGIVGFGVAAQLTARRRTEGVPVMEKLSARFLEQILAGSDGVRVLGDPQHRAPGLIMLGVQGVRSEVLLHALEQREIIVSSGSACHASRKELPESLKDAGLTEKDGAVRMSLSFDTTISEIETAAAQFIDVLRAVRAGRAGEL